MTLTITSKDLESCQPDLVTPLEVEGLEAEATVYRDKFGIPHIRAQSTRDAFLAQGFVTAQDRLWHMDYDRRRAYGRWAEYAGPQALAQDVLMRRFGLEASARADYQSINERTKEMLVAYAQGVNGSIQSTSCLPIEYQLLDATPEAWRPWDSLAIFKIRHITMGVYEQKLWRAELLRQLGPESTARLFPGYQPGQPVIVPPGGAYDGTLMDGLELLQDAASWVEPLGSADVGSNNWVVDGSRTASGLPIVAGDPHRGLDTPNVYYQNHLASPEFDVIGLSFPGLPGFPHFGHNPWVAWCITHTSADYQDLFIERFREGNPRTYQFKGEWLSAEVRRETIAVRGADPTEIEVTSTRHGPVIAGDPAEGCGLAFRYTATADPQPWADALFTMLLAHSADELEEAMRPWVDPVNNFVFADCQGNIGYRTRGQVPVRSEANFWIPVPGWTGDHEWQGVIPFEEMPHSRNPESGCIVTANNRVTEEDYPYCIALDFTPGFRARRITDRLLELKKVTVADMEKVHQDKVSIPGQQFARLIAGVQPQSELSSKAQEQLAQWDGEMSPESVAATIYTTFRDCLVRRVLRPVLGPLADQALNTAGSSGSAHMARLRAHFPRMIEEDDRSLLPEGVDWPTLMAQALTEAVEALRQKLGDDISRWRWGLVHYTRPQHPLSATFPHLATLLNPPGVAMGGDGDTPQLGSYSTSEPYVMTSMSVIRYAFDLANWDQSAWVVPLGSSGHPGSPHYADQAPIWQQVRMMPMTYSWDRLASEAESQQVLRPS